MPINHNYGGNSSDMIHTFNNVINTNRHSPNRNSAIQTIKNTYIPGTNTKFGSQGANIVYDKYVERNGRYR